MSKFDVQPVAAPKRGSFRLGNMHTTTLDFGRLQVAKIMECVPNDVINVNLNAFVQAAPNPSPINGTITFSAHAFFVPTRVVCAEWNNYILGLSNPTLPYMTAGDIKNALSTFSALGGIYATDALRHLSDFGLPLAYMNGGLNDNYRVSALPFRAFNRVWWDWYRDKQRISDANESSYVYKTMGACTATEVGILAAPQYRCFTKDYITTAYDEPSEGGVMSFAPVTFDDSTINNFVYNSENVVGQNTNNVGTRGAYGIKSSNTSTSGVPISNTQPVNTAYSRNSTYSATNTSPLSSVEGQLGTTVNGLRAASAYQRYLERLNVAGKNVISRLKALFNADDTPERLDMSEYLGGKSVDFAFQNTIATSAGTNEPSISPTQSAFGVFGADSSTANMMGQQVSNGYANLSFDNITYHAKEHGYLLIVTSILPVVANYQGIDRMFLRGVATGTCSRFDFFTPDMENLGFQPVLMSEVVTPSALSGTIPSTYDGLSVYGWQPTYMDYKYSHDVVSGDFVNPYTSVDLQSFHLGRNILRERGFITQTGAAVTGASAPTSFASQITPANLVQCGGAARTAYDDKFTISSNLLDHFIVNYKFDVVASRPMEENALPAIDNAESTSKMEIPTGGIRL